MSHGKGEGGWGSWLLSTEETRFKAPAVWALVSWERILMFSAELNCVQIHVNKTSRERSLMGGHSWQVFFVPTEVKHMCDSTSMLVA